ncbi:MAG: flavin oxidoreductase/NADH oxidase [Lachnospiraceae bacterium]|nr:flavin oxidoreductase/NADH oxidase [Lachnospiraceae bacterium]MCI9591709.1 flavin oxidoreductase/NADH oxidase [Lachnospiraceae bacterium]
MAHEKFHYRSLEEVTAAAEALNLHLPFAKDTKVLAEPLKVRNLCLPNRLGIAPMEGADSLPDGSPSGYTTRRYVKEAVGGSAVIWFEAISIAEEGCSSKTQLLLTKANLENYKQLTKEIKEAGIKANGFAPYLIMQANHSGRYSNPDNKPAPMIAFRHPELEKYRKADDSCIVTDDYLKGLEEKFGEAAKLAREAGFDAIDIKSCHGYLLAELSSAYTRPGIYGGSYENRTRLLKNGILAAKVYEDDRFMVTSRLGIYDGYPYPYGFGVSEGNGMTPDLAEPIRLVKELHEEYGMDMIDLTMGNPYATTHVTRPYDAGKYVPDEHPFTGLDRMINGIGAVKKAVPGMTIYGSAPTYLRQYADLFTAGAVEEGLCDGMLFGRMAFADPDFANEIVKEGRINPKRVCMTCGKCGDLIRAHKPTGCVIRDSKTFMPFYKEFTETKSSLPANFRG